MKKPRRSGASGASGAWGASSAGVAGGGVGASAALPTRVAANTSRAASHDRLRGMTRLLFADPASYGQKRQAQQIGQVASRLHGAELGPLCLGCPARGGSEGELQHAETVAVEPVAPRGRFHEHEGEP